MKKILREINTPDNSSIMVKEEIAPQFAAPFHFHHAYELAFIVNGRGKFYGADRLLNFNTGDIYLFGIGFPHYFVNEKSFIDSGELGHSIIVQFNEDFLGHDFYLKPEFKAVKALLKNADRGIKINQPSPEQQKILTDLVNQNGLKALVSLLQLLENLSSLGPKDLSLIGSENYIREQSIDNKTDKLDTVYQYVLQNFKGDVDTQHAANLVCMNEAAFCRYFKRRTKKTLSQFTNQVRITHASMLLAEKKTSISAVCYECGFSNLSYFNRQFKLLIGKTPFVYRKEY
ncbi:AraC family transcriptional regulator [Mucilaginibacter agri]|uniref:Helix-turn-helix domain-containing protein n=1 Tax=Mucilaginibacter agri TaxID=2695265 RepID=A0A965ZIG4_9SPHI|nr:AraC family transcriptional regulator [Mucilaginibacter agri]NCD71703.1 helix-turn-helix domain-containing protein [Mucilaginibacter agri]